MVAIQKKFLLIKTVLRKELFIQTCGPLTLGLGSGTRFVCFSLSSPFRLLIKQVNRGMRAFLFFLFSFLPTDYFAVCLMFGLQF